MRLLEELCDFENIDCIGVWTSLLVSEGNMFAVGLSGSECLACAVEASMGLLRGE